MGRRILQDGEDPARWGGSYTKEEAKGLFTQSVLNRVLYWGESWQTSAKDIQRIFPEETKGGRFFSAGWTVWDELTVSPWITTL